MEKAIKPKFVARVHHPDGTSHETELVGRVAWACLALWQAGEKGCTPLLRPAPRWSDYVFRLKKQGVDVATVHEKHGGPYSGEHARYCLRSRLSVAHWGNLPDFLESPAGREFAGIGPTLLGEVA